MSKADPIFIVPNKHIRIITKKNIPEKGLVENLSNLIKLLYVEKGDIKT